jgi:hypothetical protein
MILTTSVEWSDRPSSNDHLGHSIKKRDPGRQEGAAAEKAVSFSTPFFDAKPLLASHRGHELGWKMQERAFEHVQHLTPKRRNR